MPLPSSPSSRFLSLPESRSSSSTLCPSSPPSSKAHSNSLSSESASRSPPIPLGTDLCHRFVPLHRDRTGDRPGRLVRSLPTVGNGRPPLDPRSCLNQLSPLASPHQHTPRDFPSLPKTPLLPEHRSPPHLPHTLPLPLTPLSSNIIPPRPDHNLPISSAAPAYLGNISSITPSLDSSARRCPPRRPIVGSSVFPTEPSPSFYLLRPLDLPQIRHYLWSRFPPIPIPNRMMFDVSIFLIHTLFQPISKSIIVIFRPHILLTIIIL